MDFKAICIDGVSYGDCKAEEGVEEECNSRGVQRKAQTNVDFKDSRLFEEIARNNKSVWKALYCLAICHNVIAEQPDVDDIEKDIRYSAASPDELALVSFAKYAGVAFEAAQILENTQFYNVRNHHSHKNEMFEVLQVFEFDSTRKRFSIIVKTAAG